MTEKLSDEERRARALTLDQAAAKIQAEYGDALLLLGCRPVIQRIWPYTVEDHVAFARDRGIILDPSAQQVQRDYLDLLRGATPTELGVVVGVLTKLLEFDRLETTDRQRLIHEIICVLTCAEVCMGKKVEAKDE